MNMPTFSPWHLISSYSANVSKKQFLFFSRITTGVNFSMKLGTFRKRALSILDLGMHDLSVVFNRKCSALKAKNALAVNSANKRC